MGENRKWMTVSRLQHGSTELSPRVGVPFPEMASCWTSAEPHGELRLGGRTRDRTSRLPLGQGHESQGLPQRRLGHVPAAVGTVGT